MSLKKANYFICRSFYKSAKVYATIILLIIAVLFTIEIIFSGPASNANVSGVGTSISIYIFVLGLVSYSSFIKMLFQNGISRNTIWKSLIISFAIFSLIFAIASVLISEILIFVSHTYFNFSFSALSSEALNYFYPGMNLIVGIFLKIFAVFIALLFSGALGIAMGTLFKILSTKWKVIVFAGIPAFVFIILPIFLAIIGSSAYVNTFFKLAKLLVGNPPSLLRITTSLIIISGILIMASKLFISKIQIDE